MNLTLALRAVTLLAFVAISTVLIVQPDALGLQGANGTPPVQAIVSLINF